MVSVGGEQSSHQNNKVHIDMATWAIINNPTSGSFRPDRLAAAVSVLRAEGIEVQQHPTERPGHATELAASLTGVERILAHGGDGTLNEVANGMLQRKGAGAGDVALAFLPGGTANGMAFELGLPRNPAKAAQQLLKARPQPVRPGMVNGRAFLLMAGFGFDGLAVYMVGKAVKSRLGAAAYLVMGVRALWHPKPVMRVTLPDGRQHQGVWVVGSRGRRYGGMFFIHPKAALQAPDMGVTVVSKAMIAPFAFTHMLTGHGWRGGGINLPTAPNFRVESETPVYVQVDGEYLGQGNRFEVTQSETALSFCMP